MKKRLLAFSIFILIFVTCSSPESNVAFQSVHYSYQNRNFSVVPAYLNMKLFVEETKKNPAKISQLYEKIIYQPIFRSFVAKGKYPEIMETLKSSITDIAALLARMDFRARTVILPKIPN